MTTTNHSGFPGLRRWGRGAVSLVIRRHLCPSPRATQASWCCPCRLSHGRPSWRLLRPRPGCSVLTGSPVALPTRGLCPQRGCVPWGSGVCPSGSCRPLLLLLPLPLPQDPVLLSRVRRQPLLLGPPSPCKATKILCSMMHPI